MLPNFLVIGAAKSATSRLCVLLGRHPDVFLCEPKEPHFFARDEVFANGMNWYEGLFEGAAGKKAVGEGSTTYTKLPLHPQSAERIARHLPDARLIYIVRHPIDRIESDYIEALKGGYAVGADFNKALREFPHFVESSCYWKQISAYRRLFPDERILVLFFEDFNADPASVLRRCFVFLGVDPSVNLGPLNERANVSEGAYADNHLWATIKRQAWLRSALRGIFGFVPIRVRNRFLRGRVTERPKFDEPTRAWVTQQVRQDAAQFLPFYGKPADFWKL